MADLIDRQQAIDTMRMFIDSLNKDSPAYKSLSIAFDRCIIELKKLPSAQPEIIRCKDCKNWDTTWTNDFSPNYHYCPMVDGVRKEDWFCADAERRTE